MRADRCDGNIQSRSGKRWSLLITRRDSLPGLHGKLARVVSGCWRVMP